MSNIVKAIMIGAGVIIGAGVVKAITQKKEEEEKEVKVTLLAEPYPVEILVDGKPVTTPCEITLKKGFHTFKTSPISLNLTLQYEFYCWTIDHYPISYYKETTIFVDKPITLKALYILSESYPATIPLIT